jgi:hypothetical protein
MSRNPLGVMPMDKYKLQLLRERDEVWAEARESMPLFEKLFSGDTSNQEEAEIGWTSIKLIATELYTYSDEIKSISQELLDSYSKEIKSGEIDTLKFANREIDTLKDKIVKVGRKEKTRDEVESNLEEIREYIKNIRLIFLYNISTYFDIIGKILLDVLDEDSRSNGEFTEEEQAALARCKIMTYYLLVLEEAEIESLDGSWFK